MVYLADTQVVLNNNGFSIKNNVEYIWVKFIQDSKMTKESIEIFFNNPELAFIQTHLSYKSVNEMKVLLTMI